jgi:hypothetical protein
MDARKAMSAAVVLVLTALSAAPAQAGPWREWRGSGGWGAGGSYQRMYNAATVESIAGEVMSIDKITPAKGMSSGVHITVRTEKETIPVHLGPAWYLERLDTKIAKGDSVQVKGSRITFGGKPAIIAAEVQKGDAVLQLRDESGFPTWAGWRR